MMDHFSFNALITISTGGVQCDNSLHFVLSAKTQEDQANLRKIKAHITKYNQRLKMNAK